MSSADTDYLIIGGGFYGCCLALFLRSTGLRVTLLEASDRLMSRASQVNQARIHTGFHYPRSALTAVRSKMLSRRFATEFSEAVTDDFQMLYAIAARGSKVSANRFMRFFSNMQAPIREADPRHKALFNPEMVEGVFECHEAAFDCARLGALIGTRLDKHGVTPQLSARVLKLAEEPGRVVAQLADGREISARHVFNVTYAEINQLLRQSELPLASLKHEISEIVLIEPPASIADVGITVMDGPFFSSMPYPSRDCYSLTHVRYTPQLSWVDAKENVSPYHVFERSRKPSKARYMINDAQRYVPCLSEVRQLDSIFEVKTILLKTENDDARPILFHRGGPASRVISVMGGKIDNVYDLFELIRQAIPECCDASDELVTGRTT